MKQVEPKYRENQLLYYCRQLKGTDLPRLYCCKIRKVITGVTPKGNPKKPKYEVDLVGFTYDGKISPVLSEDTLRIYSETPVEAVNNGYHSYMYRVGVSDNDSVEDRLLRAIYGTPAPPIGRYEENLPKVIRALQRFQILYKRAHEIESKDRLVVEDFFHYEDEAKTPVRNNRVL